MDDLKRHLAGLATRASHGAKVEQWATNTLEGIPDEILPRLPEHAMSAITRLAGLCESVGPRIVETRKFGTIGDINWGGDNASLDEALTDQDLEGLAGSLLEQGMMHGVMAGVARRDETGGIILEPLVGHVEVFPPKRPEALVHAWVEDTSTTGGVQSRWTVRIYDLQGTMREWVGLRRPEEAATKPPTSEVTASPEYPAGAPIPRFVIVNRRPQTHRPFGEIDRLLPLIQSDWSSQLRGDRAEENTAFPQLKVIGEAEDGTSERSTAHIIRLHEGGDAAFLDPGDLSQLHTHLDRKLQRLREDAAMPGGFMGAQTPSGEALREHNQRFISACQSYAKHLTRMLTMLAADLAVALTLPPAPVTVGINREFSKATEIEMIVSLYEKGLLEFGAAVRAVSVFVPTWSSEEVEAYIQAAMPNTRGAEWS